MCKRFCLLFLITLVISACNKPDPQPELGDQIYQDMLSEQKIADSGVAQAEKDLEEHRKALNEVKPQTGQIKYAQKRIYDAEHRLDRFKQQQKYWIVRSESRRDFVRQKSLEAFNKGEKWSDSKEFEVYLSEKRLRSAKLNWDARERRSEFLENEKKPAKSVPQGE